MRKASNILFSFLVAMLVPSLAFASLALSGTTTNVQYVYSEISTSDDVEVTDYSDAAESSDDSDFEFFNGDGEDVQSLYIGMEVPFDKVKFDLTGSVEFDDEATLEWEYFNGSDWKDLDMTTDDFSDFETVDKESVSFEIPGSWDKESFEFGDDSESPEAYWIRVSADEVESGGAAEQISVVAYLAEITVEGQDGSRVINLSEENFSVSEGTDNTLYGVINEGNGVYRLALNTEASVTDYRLIVYVPGFDQLATTLEMDGDSEVEKTVALFGDDACAPEYDDIAFHWAQSAVRELYCRQILQISTDSFNPNTRVSRGEFLKMALVNAGVDTALYTYKSNPFNDVDREDDWYAEYALAAYHLDVIDEDNYFNADYSLNRAEAVAILIRLAGIEEDRTTTPFYDIASSDWYAAFVRAASDMGVVEGYPDGSFQGERYLSRAESAVMVNNMYYAKYEDQ